MWTAVGCLSFCLFFLGDWNDWKWETPLLRCCFPAGFLLLAVSTFSLAKAFPAAIPVWWSVSLLILSGVFLCLLVYTLFFALPAKEAYATQEDFRPVCTTGVYALCRHPGVLWFAGLYLCLWPAAGIPLVSVILFNALNLLLVWFEDTRVFPARLSGYAEYRRTTPFLLPNWRSIRACFQQH